jgi:hypothetical protein
MVAVHNSGSATVVQASAASGTALAATTTNGTALTIGASNPLLVGSGLVDVANPAVSATLPIFRITDTTPGGNTATKFQSVTCDCGAGAIAIAGSCNFYSNAPYRSCPATSKDDGSDLASDADGCVTGAAATRFWQCEALETNIATQGGRCYATCLHVGT